MAWHKTDTGLLDHPKLIVTAADLEIKTVYLLGHLVTMWLRARDKYEDGDLSRLNNAMIAGLADWNIKTADRFVQALREYGWLDETLIHDWLDYAGEYLVKKYKTSNRKRLVEIWAKYGRVYGETQGSNKEVPPLPKGTEQEQTRKQLGTEQEHQDIDQETTIPPPAHARIGERGDGQEGDDGEPPPPYDPPDIPKPLLDLARQVIGLTPEGILTGWMTVQGWSTDWITKALMRSCEQGKRGRKAVSYSRGILEDWSEIGGPEKDSPQWASDARRQPPRQDKPRPPAGSRLREMAIAQGMNPDDVCG